MWAGKSTTLAGGLVSISGGVSTERTGGGVSVAFVDGAYSFSETERESQRLSVVPELANGRRVTLHANYAPPPNFGHAAVELRGDGAECRRWLTGKLSLFVE